MAWAVPNAYGGVSGGGARPGQGIDMAEWEMLNTETHADLAVWPATAAGRHFAQVVPIEFGKVAARSPILLTKHADTGRFYAGALYGFVAGENLLVDAAGALDAPMPLELERGGFFVAGDDMVIDRDHPRFAPGGAVPLFEADRTPADALRRVQRALTLLKTGLEQSEAFVGTLLELGLVEPIDISLSFDDGERIVLEGLYSISRDALGDLDDPAVTRLFRSGYLELAYVLIGSLAQIPLLARRRNDRLALG